MKKIICLALACAMLLTGCSGNSGDPNVENSSVQTGDPETESSSTQTDELSLITVAKAYEDGPFSVPRDELRNLSLTLKYNEKTVFDGFVGIENIISKNQFVFSPGYCLRQSSGTMYAKSVDDELFYKGIANNVKAMTFLNETEFSTPYIYILEKPVATLNDDRSLNELKYSYQMNGLSLNCFVNVNNNGDIELIIDPAYMQGVPMCSDENASYDFSVGNYGFKGDTFSIAATCPYNMRPTESCYAKVDFDLSYEYSLVGGNASTAKITNFELLTNDIKGVLSDKYSMVSGNGKDPAMSSTYNALFNNIEKLKTGHTVGVALIDLDFNGTPEVIISNELEKIKENEEDYSSPYVNSDVYYIDGEKLVYVDTLYNYRRVLYETGNVLGLKTLDNCSQAWFQMSYIDRSNGKTCKEGELGANADVDYLITFDGKKLHFTEAIRAETIANPKNPDINMDIYVMGEKQKITVNYDYDPYYDPDSEDWADAKKDWPYFHCGNLSASHGIWELLGFIKQRFCQDMTESTYSLDSNWLADITLYDSSEPLSVTDRMISYRLAALVDAYYLGNFNPSLKTYAYEFLGGYAKPVIYLYPENETKVDVSVDFKDKDGKITCSYPEYKNGWTVTAEPDGTLYDENKDEYYCLYWEGEGKASLDISKGFCVKGSDTAAFLREKLLNMGFTAREANEMIIYWLPLMEKNQYNVISLHTSDYADAVALNVSPKPDSVIRVFMTFYASDKPVAITKQILPQYARNGFTVVEWGGAEITTLE